MKTNTHPNARPRNKNAQKASQPRKLAAFRLPASTLRQLKTAARAANLSQSDYLIKILSHEKL